MNPELLAQILRTLRRRAGLSQSALAERIGTQQGTVSSYELGKTMPTLDTVLKLAEVFGLSLAAFGSILDAAAAGEDPLDAVLRSTSDTQESPDTPRALTRLLVGLQNGSLSLADLDQEKKLFLLADLIGRDFQIVVGAEGIEEIVRRRPKAIDTERAELIASLLAEIEAREPQGREGLGPGEKKGPVATEAADLPNSIQGGLRRPS